MRILKSAVRMLTVGEKRKQKKKHIKITSRNRMKKEGEFDCKSERLEMLFVR